MSCRSERKARLDLTACSIVCRRKFRHKETEMTSARKDKIVSGIVSGSCVSGNCVKSELRKTLKGEKFFYREWLREKKTRVVEEIEVMVVWKWYIFNKGDPR